MTRSSLEGRRPAALEALPDHVPSSGSNALRPLLTAPCSLTDLPPSLCLHPSPTRNTLLAGLVSWVGWEEDSPHDGPLWTLVSPHSGTGTCD